MDVSTVTRKSIAILGYPYKKSTTDIREAAAINVARNLLEDGAHLRIYDPEVSAVAIKNSLFPSTTEAFSVGSSLIQACRDAAALVFGID